MPSRATGSRHAVQAAGALLLALLAPPSILPQAPPPQPTGKPAHISVQLDAPLGPSKPLFTWFGYDEANYTTTPNGRHLLRELHDLAPTPVTIRMHHLLTSGNGTPELKWSSTGVYHEDLSGHPVYDFTLLDGIFDALHAAGVRPMVELGFMPEDLAATLPGRHEPYQVHYPASTVSGASNNPPKDFAKWRDLVHAVTAHLVTRYGRDEVSQWHFEVWNEPDIDYWHDTPEAYWKFYDFAVAGIRSALPGALVGGPASTGPGAGPSGNAFRFLDRFLSHVEHDRSAATGGPIPLSFISFHAKGHPTLANGHVTMGLQNELNDVDQGFRILAAHPRLSRLPVILSEADPEGCAACSSKVNPANNYRNGTLYPAYTAAAYKSLLTLQTRYRTNLLAMLSWSFEFEDHDFFEGFRSLSTNGIDKPVLNLFRMLGLLGGTRVAVTSDSEVPLDAILHSGVRDTPDIDALATRSDAHTAAVLAWNYADPAEPAPAAPVTISVTGLPAAVHRVLVTHFRIDDHHSNAYTVWQTMGSPQHPTPEQFATLQSRAGLELLTSPTWAQAADGKLTLTTDLPRQAISLLQLSW